MSGVEHDAASIESRSKVKVTRNAKGDAQWEISVVSGEQVEEMVRLREIAVAQYRALQEQLA